MAKKSAKEVSKTPLGSPRTFRIGRKRFVIGLFWQAAENGRTVRKEARELAHERGINADLHLKRVREQSGEAQFALARTFDGVPRKSISAAGALADEIPQESWAGVFPLNDGWWYVRVRNGMILPNGDGYYEEETDARNRVKLDIGDGGFERVFAPEGWDQAADEIDFERLLAGARGPQVIDINPVKANRGALATLGFVAVAALIGWQGWSYYQSIGKADEEQRKAREAFKESINKPEEKKEIPPPWHSQPMPSSAIYSCARSMTELSTNAPGFKLEEIRCSGGTTRFFWRRQERSNIRWIERWIERQGDYDVNVNPAGEVVTVNVSVNRGEARETEPIYPAKVVRNGLISLGQATDTNIRTGDVRRWEPPGAYDPQKYKQPDYATMPVEIQVSSVDDWVEILDDIPGLVITTVTWDHPSKSYEITGEVYVQS